MCEQEKLTLRQCWGAGGFTAGAHGVVTVQLLPSKPHKLSGLKMPYGKFGNRQKYNKTAGGNTQDNGVWQKQTLKLLSYKNLKKAPPPVDGLLQPESTHFLAVAS